MDIHLYIHSDDGVNRKLDEILRVQQRQGVLMSAAFDALKVEVDELKASSDLAIAKIEELRALIMELGNAPTEEQIAEVTAKVDEVQNALQGEATSPA